MSRHVTLDYSDFRASHLDDPRGRAAWIFVNAETGEEVQIPHVTMTEAKRKLPAGTWVVLP